MNCPQCSHPNAENRNYCGECGYLLVTYCRYCGFRNHCADNFCGGCGNGLSGEPRPAPDSALLSVRRMPLEEPVLFGTPHAETGAEGVSELIELARQSQKEPEEQADVKVTQDDIDSLFGA